MSGADEFDEIARLFRPLTGGAPGAFDLLDDAAALVNATSLGLVGGEPLDIALDALPAGAVVMDMVYRPLETTLLARARAEGRPVADGLEMLIRQAIPSFEAFFGRSPPGEVDSRALALTVLEPQT